jgi:hypothetical protein
MYYQFLVAHLDAPFLLLSAVTTGLLIRIFYKQYMSIQLGIRVIVSVMLFTINAIIIVPGIVSFISMDYDLWLLSVQRCL